MHAEPVLASAMPQWALFAALVGLIALGGVFAYLFVALTKDNAEPVAPGGDSDSEGEEFFGDKKAAKKAAKKREKREGREADRQEEEERKEKKEGRAAKYDEKRKAKDAEREEAERQAELELQKQAEEREKEEQAEFDKWKDMFTVDDGGTVEDEIAQESQGLLNEFVDFIKTKKIVVLEEIAAEFGLRTQDVINRIQALESMGRLTGVMDDRGKFIYVSAEEMAAVADYIRKRGRVSIAELAGKSNEFIDLSAPDLATLTEEDLAAMDQDADEAGGEAVASS